jgi:hypothetical protein
MRLSLKISAFTAVGILLVLSTDGYLRGQRELRSLRNDIERDHRALGRILVTVTTVTAERAGPKPALQFARSSRKSRPIQPPAIASS